MTARTCLLCTSAGRTPGRHNPKSAICNDCHAMLRAQGRGWCAVCRHPARGVGRNRRCHDCDAREHRERRAAAGMPPRPRMSEDERRAAQRERSRRWRQRNPEYLRAWKQANRDYMNAYRRRYRVRRKLAILRGAQ